MRNILIALAMSAAFAFPAHASDWPQPQKRLEIALRVLADKNVNAVEAVLCAAKLEETLKAIGEPFATALAACAVQLMPPQD